MISIKIQINFRKKKPSQKKNKLFSSKCNFLTRKISPAVFFSTIILSLFLAMGINLAFAWTDPGANPPSGNVATPINVSGTYQTKSGGLRVDSLRTDGDIQVDGGNIYDPSGSLWVEGEDNVHVKIDRNDDDSNRYFAVRSGGDGDNWRFLVYENGNTYIRNNLRVPIIYDWNDLSYYIDPAGTSKLNCINLGGTTECSWPSGGIAEEKDTFQSVTDRGNETTNDLIIDGAVKFGDTVEVDNYIYSQQYIEAKKTLFAGEEVRAEGNIRTKARLVGALARNTCVWKRDVGYVICDDGRYVAGVDLRGDGTVKGVYCCGFSTADPPSFGGGPGDPDDPHAI